MTARQIILEGGSPWGFRMHGGADVQQPLRISRVNPGSKAAARGVREGDVITTINGESTRNKTNSEAHALLKSAGNTLKLGLNQDCIGGSPKKRQYNNSNDNNTTSTQQEVLTETIKRSNIITKFIISSSSTSTSSSATTTTTNLRTETPTTDNPASNRNEISKENIEKNGFKLNGDSSIKPTPKDYYFSDRSTISSNYSSAASTPSTLTESQVSSSPSTQQRDDQITMSDSGSSRSRRRKRPNAKGKRPVPEESNYRVESPKTVLQKRKSSLTKKSKSLDDDDDSIEIREVCETGECSAVEDDSDPIIWEVVEDMNVNQIPNETVKVTMTRTLKLEDKAELQSITPEDETKLRCFLEGLQLVSTPEEAADMAVQSRESAESIKARRAKKREELAQYFLPVYQNPRFLDVISEENSDQSDKEQKERTISQKTIITETDSARIPIISDTCTTSMAQTGSSVEIVYLEDSSGCESESAESVEDPHADAVDVKDVLSSQLTPPPTPDEKLEEIRQISKETVMPHQNSQIQCFNLHEIEGDKTPQIPMQRVNVVSPSHLSECSGDSSSRGTSLCTTIYRDELPNDMLSLRELCLKKLISLPFGRDVLEELASVSESLEELTNNLSSTHQLHHNNSNNTASSSVKLTQNTTEDRFNTSDGFDISAVSTEAKAPVGTKNLLDLHEKFAQIRGNHQNTVDESPSNRLLAFIRGSDASESTTAKSGGHVPEQRVLDERSGDEARLDARNLSEWLNLARAKSGSVPHLNNLDDMKDPLPKRDEISARRRRSLPQEIYVQQMQYLIQKEKEIQQELEKLEEEKRKLASEMNTTGDQHQFDPTQYKISKNQDIAIHQPNPSKSTIPPESERFRQNMYDEYMTQIAKRQDRQQHKVIKISSHQLPTTEKKGKLEAIHVKGIEDEFMNKVKQRKLKYAAATSEDSADYASLPERSDAEDSEPVLVMDGDSLSEAKRLPKHLKEFVAITREAASNLDTEDGIWSPGSQKDPTSSPEGSLHVQRSLDQDTEPIPPVWAPKSAGSSPSLERKEFRSVNFGSPVLGRKNKEGFSENTSVGPPWRNPSGSSDISVALSSSLEKRIPNSYSAPGFSDFPNSRLPKAQNPTITLLQKARGGHLPKGAAYIEQDSNPHLSRHDPSPPKLAPGEIVYEIKHEYTSESENERPKKMADLSQRKYPMGIGPTTKDGMPLTLRSEVKDQNQSKWYKRMYDTIHKQKPRYDGRYPYNSGYLSEPEPGAYDSDASIYDHRVTTLDRRRTQPAPANGASGDDNYVISYTMPRSSTNSYIPQTSTIIKHGKEVYKNQPGRIENYVPGRSSISDKEAKEWWDEVMDIFDGHLEQQKHTPHKGYMSQALKESGYESDSTLVFRRRDENINQLSPSEQREAYKTIQRGGDVPLHGLRKPAPERPKDDLNIEYIPISPNLTKIRVHKSPIGDRLNDFLVYPVETEHIFANYKRTAPSSLSMSKSFPPIPPSPPKRKSSRNNSTLRLISTMRVSSEKPAKRHKTCFTSTADVNKSNVKFLRDKITCKLSSVPKRRGEAKLRVTKTLTANPELKSKVTTTLAAVKDPKTSGSRIYSKTNISRDDSVERSCLSRSSSTNSVRKACRSCSATQGKKSKLEKSRTTSLDRTFGSEKKKVDLVLSKSASEKRLVKSPDLLSPTEVKKASLITLNPLKSKPTKTIPKVQTKLHDLPIKVSISEKGRELLQGKSRSLRSRTDSVSPSPSLSSDKSKLSRSTTSLESIKSSKTKREKTTLKKAPSVRSLKSTPSKENLCVSKKAKKDQLNDEIVKKEKKNGKTKIRDPAKAVGKVVGNEIAHGNFDSKIHKNPITLEDIKRQKQNVDTSSFFQNLFLRDNPTSNSITCSANSWIAEKTLALQRRSVSISEPSIGALKIYLNHTKPVTDSKFKTMDAQLIRSRSVSPKNVRWEDETRREYPRKSLGYERSSSLPPKLVFTETARPISPIIQRRRLDTDSTRTTIIRPTSPQKMIFTETRRPISPVLKRKSTLKRIEKKKQQPEKIIFTETVRPISPEIRSRSASPKAVTAQKPTPPETLYFSQTSRPISPVIEASPDAVIRSPSYRKIRSLHGDSLEYIRRKAPRSRSAGDVDENHYKGSDFDPPSLTQSTSSIDSLKEYQTYVKEVIHSTKKSDRFKDLNKFYSTIERLGELERTTSSADLRPRRKGEEEIIDYDRWKEVRQREKAEKELGEIYKELKVTQKEKDFLFAPKQVETYRWKKDFDRGLRIKEKSVEDIREEFERLKLFEDRNNNLRDFDYRRDTYKPLWRGNSVANLAQTMTERRSQSEGRSIPSRQRRIDSERFLTRGIGSRIWSSLSMEQVNVLKNQLAEIYQNGSKKGTQQPKEYVIEVPSDTHKDSHSVLTVRRNSDSSKSMSETDKRRISQSLSKEILERQRQRYKTSVSLVLGKETRGAVAAADAKVKQTEPPSPRTCYSLEMSEDGEKDPKKTSDGDFLLVLAKSDTKNKANIKETLTEWAQPKKALISTDAVNIPPKTTSSESGSTDGSTKTVICADKKEDVKKKVEYFEKVRETQDYTPTIYKAADSTSGSPEEIDDNVTLPKTITTPLRKHSPLSRSQQDLKELFGETEMAKVASPTISTIPSSGASVKSPLTRSTESVYRSRSLSPHPDLYYFALTKGGDVSKLKNKFERKWNSDSQIDKKSQISIPGQMLGEVDHLRRRYEYPALSGRGRSRIRRGGVVSPIYLKAEDRFMPHINIISKIASLYPRKSVREDRQDRSIEDLAEILGITVGEVNKLRAKFDSPDRGDVSLLGHMFTSSPNLHELRDIAPYLTASWTAHRFPKREDNERPLTPPVPPPTSAPSVVCRPKSASPSRGKAKLSSILKPESPKAVDGRKQEFNASAHRPVSRYQPPVPRTQEPARYRSWWGPSVTFKEPDAPTPPPKGLSRRASEPESPRKYVENEVTIHYRTPVRQEIKEALSEDELQRRQAEHMKKIYQEERRRKYLQELQDMHSRRHADNFTPSQKSPIPLNRYDDFLDDYSPKLKPRPRSPEPRLVAKALYNFVGQSARELTFRKGDIIYIRRQVDKNWYEGEHNAMVGLFPANYVEIVPYDGVKTTVRKPHEGQARAKYNFIAQTHLELSLAKGELVVITRKVDDNWFEGKIGGRKGIFPVSYVDVLIDPGTPPQSAPSPTKPVAAPAAHSLLLNGSSGGKESMGAHNYVPPFHGSDSTPSYHAKPVQVTGSGTYGSLSRTKNLNQALHIDTQSEPVPYRALYKYKPQNEDELELLEGDTVYVLEKCDDGWYVGSSDRTGAFGTFPGNYVERI